MKVETITSGQNPKIKELLSLQEKSRTRREKGLFVVEGVRELEHCLNSGFQIDTVFICEEILGESKMTKFFALLKCQDLVANCPNSTSLKNKRGTIENEFTFKNTQNGSKNIKVENIETDKPSIKTGIKVVKIPAAIYNKVAYRGSTEGIIAEVKYKERSLSNLQLSPNPLIIVLESVEKPGNLGAVLRSADAAGADAVIICDPLTDLYNPNLIRSSIGAVFSRQVATCSSEEAINFFKDNRIQILTAQLQDSQWYYDSDMTKGTAIVMGTESTGLTDCWRKAADKHIKIPMLGQLDSLNVSVSAAILLFEAVRQRNN